MTEEPGAILKTEEDRKVADLLGITEKITGKPSKAAAKAEAAPEPKPEPKAEAEKPTVDLDGFYKTLSELPDEEKTKLLKHEALKPLTDREVQSRKDQELHKIRAEERDKVRREAEQFTREQYLRNLPDDDYGRLLRQDARARQEVGNLITNWWLETQGDIKTRIPEMQSTSPEAWAEKIRQYPESFGQLIAALVEEVAGQRVEKKAAELEKEAESRAKVLAEAMFKEKWAKSTGETPDLVSSAPSAGDDKTFLKDYGAGRVSDHARATKLLAALK